MLYKKNHYCLALPIQSVLTLGSSWLIVNMRIRGTVI